MVVQDARFILAATVHHDGEHPKGTLLNKEEDMREDNKKQTATASLSFLDLLAITFIVLKLLGKITWSWWWVLAPVWMPLAIVIVIVVVALIIAAAT